MKAFIFRHQPAPSSPKQWIMSGVGAAIAVGLLGAITAFSGTPMLMASFGASCVLLFCVQNSPLSQPINVVGGHVLSTAIGLVLLTFLPNVWWAAAFAVGITIAAMMALRLTHPPAGANPLVVFATDPGFGFLVFPVLIGALLLVAVATIFHRQIGGVYPIPTK